MPEQKRANTREMALSLKQAGNSKTSPNLRGPTHCVQNKTFFDSKRVTYMVIISDSGACRKGRTNSMDGFDVFFF